MKNSHVTKTSNAESKLMEWFNKPKVVFVVWTLLFIMTLIFNELSLRALVTAFTAWVGGLVTARLDYILRRDRIYKDVADKLSKNRKFNRNVY